MESKGIHKDDPGHGIIRFSACRGFVFSAFLHGRRGRGLAVEPVTSNRKSMVAGQARQHAAAADICADKLTLYKSSPRAAKRRFFFLQKIRTRQKASLESRACALALARPRPGLATCPPTWGCPRKAVADLDPATRSNHGQARLTQTRPGLALSLQHRLSCPKQAYNRSTKPGNTGAAPRDQKRSNPSARCHLPLTKNRKNANIWTGHGTRNPTLARTCANHKQNLPRNDRASRACATVA